MTSQSQTAPENDHSEPPTPYAPVVLPHDARDQIERALLGRTNISGAAAVMSLLMTWPCVDRSAESPGNDSDDPYSPGKIRLGCPAGFSACSYWNCNDVCRCNTTEHQHAQQAILIRDHRAQIQQLQGGIHAIVNQHKHQAYDAHCRLTDDLAKMDPRYGLKCAHCGNVDNGVYCRTLTTLAEHLETMPADLLLAAADHAKQATR